MKTDKKQRNKNSFISRTYDAVLRNSENNYDNRFFLENEIKINVLTVKYLRFCVLYGPVLMLFKALNIFPDISYSNAIVYSFVMIVVASLHYFVIKKYPDKVYTKYIILISFEIIIIMLSADIGIKLFISYIIVPLISCLYFDKHFSFAISLVCYLFMLISLYTRAFFTVPFFNDSLLPMEWLKAYSLGMTIEFFLNIVVINFIVTRNYTILKEEFEYNKKIIGTQSSLVTSFAELTGAKEEKTANHLANTSQYVFLIANMLKTLPKYSKVINGKLIDTMVLASALHDVGHISVPDEILRKGANLTTKEKLIRNQHTVDGEKIIRENMYMIDDRQYLKIAREMALYHHENWNGSGYPKGLKETDIPLHARIMAGANIMDAQLNNASGKTDTADKAFLKIKEVSGKYLDPDVAWALLALRKKILTIANNAIANNS